jgi:hypothetical protein
VARAEPSAGELATARQLFQEATALERRSAWREAGEKLDAALAIKETPGLHFHRAHCAEQLGELVRAARHYARSDELIVSGQPAPDVEELLAPARARVLARVARLTLELPSDVTGATLEIDGTLVREPPGTPVLLDPGRHRVVARAPGRRDFEMETTLIEGQTQILEVAFAPPPSADSPPNRPPATKSRATSDTASSFGTREVVLIGEATVVVAGLAAGIGFSIARGSAQNRIDAAHRSLDAGDDDGATECSDANPPSECAELQSAIDDHKQASRFATIGFVTAGVGAITTILTWAIWPTDRPATALGVAPQVGGATLVVNGAF